MTATGKTCRKCGTHYEHAAAGFYEVTRRGRLVFSYPCKRCRRDYHRTTATRDAEKHRETVRRFYARNAERERERVRSFYRDHPDRKRAQRLQRKARARGAEGGFSVGEVRLILAAQRRRCFWCDAPLSVDYHLDHIIPLVRGGTNWAGNIVAACAECNLKKGAQLPLDWAPRRWREVATA